MKTGRSHGRGGFALIIVMVIITVLGILAGGFAFSMKVETRLAGNSNGDSEMEWLGRSGVEFARYVLANIGGSQQGGNVITLAQFWAGGPGLGGETNENSVLAGLSLTNNRLGAGVFSVRIVDLERKINLNSIVAPLVRRPDQKMVGDQILDRALTQIGVQGGDLETIRDSIVDWVDTDDHPGLSGAESDFYLGLDPPYVAKNGPMDDLSEMLLIHGVTPEIYWGPAASGHQNQLVRGPRHNFRQTGDAGLYPVGLVDLFTTWGLGTVNINTASKQVLQVILNGDESMANAVIQERAGPDEIEGTEDDKPLHGLQEITRLQGLMQQGLFSAQGLGVNLGGMSTVFEVTVDAQIGNDRRQYVATLARSGAQVQVLQFSRK